MPFHQPWAGSVVSTVRVPAVTGLIEMLFRLLVILQFPKLASDADAPVPARFAAGARRRRTGAAGRERDRQRADDSYRE